MLSQLKEELLYRYNPWWENSFMMEGIINRKNILEKMNKNLNNKHIIFLTGLRRVGKTTLLKLFIQSLILKKEVNPKHIFYISLDDYLISGIPLHDLIEKYRKIHKLPFKQKVYLFFDEITYQKNCELQLKNLFDQQNVKIFTSSSSASLLRSKKPYLTGRSSLLEILPLSFSEYLDFKNIQLSKSDKHLREEYFEDYLETGGIPEYVLHGDIEYIKELVDDILYKDISAFYNIKNTQLLKDFFLLLMERAGKVVSINKLAHILEISPDTAKRYLYMFTNSYLIYLLPRYGKTNERILSPKKIYAADLGIRNIFTGFRDKGSLFENYVYLSIKNKNPAYVYQNTYEIDFFTEEKTLIEVKYGRELIGKQKDLFDSFKASKKMIIKNIYDVEKYLL